MGPPRPIDEDKYSPPFTRAGQAARTQPTTESGGKRQQSVGESKTPDPDLMDDAPLHQSVTRTPATKSYSQALTDSHTKRSGNGGVTKSSRKTPPVESTPHKPDTDDEPI